MKTLRSRTRARYPRQVVLEPGELIADRFEVEAAVGGGGMSYLYSARDRATGQHVALEASDPVAAERAARAALAIASAEPVLPLNQAESLAIVAQALLAQGRGDEALVHAQRALEQHERLGGIDDGEAIIRLTWAEALAAVGRRAEAIAAGDRARARLLERAAAITDPALRASFLERVPENARTFARRPSLHRLLDPEAGPQD